MEITEVRVFPIAREDERLRAFATIVFENCFVVRDLRVIQGNGGLFVAMPSRKRSDGTYSDVAHPLVPELRNYIEAKVIGEYHRQMESGASPPGPSVEPGVDSMIRCEKVAV